MKDEDKIYGLMAQAEELQEQTKNFISQAQTVLDELSSAAKKPVERATKELNKSIKKVEDDFSSTGMKFILVIGISILFIFLTCVFSFKYLLNGYMNDLEEIKYNIKNHQETLEQIQSETWGIKLIKYNDGSSGIVLPKTMQFNRAGKDNKGQWHIIIEK